MPEPSLKDFHPLLEAMEAWRRARFLRLAKRKGVQEAFDDYELEEARVNIDEHEAYPPGPYFIVTHMDDGEFRRTMYWKFPRETVPC